MDEEVEKKWLEEKKKDDVIKVKIKNEGEVFFPRNR